MIIVSENSIQKAYSSLEAWEDEDIFKYLEAFAKRQPVLFSYLMVMEEELEGEDSNALIQLFIIIQKAFENEAGEIPVVNHLTVQEAEAKLLETFRNIFETQEEELLLRPEMHVPEPVQPFLMQFLLAEVMVPEELDENLGALPSDLNYYDPNARSTVFSTLQVTIEALHQALNTG